MKILRKFNEAIGKEKINFKGNKGLKYLMFEDKIEHEGELYKLVEKNKTRFDGEKGFVDYDIVIRRISDKKYFKGEGTDYGHHDREVEPIFYEVERKEKTIYYYE